MISNLKDETKEQSLERILSELTVVGDYENVSYLKNQPNHRMLNINTVMDEEAFVDFIAVSQSKKYESLRLRSPNMYRSKLIEGFTQAVEANGLLHVFHRGFDVLGTHFLAFQPLPENQMDTQAMSLFNDNRFFCARQFHYSKQHPGLSIDMVLLINGIPVVAIELKNYFTGQSSDDAVAQFCKDRDQSELMFRLNRRCLVMFAVDNYDVQMTTYLNGLDTNFIPFNQGSNGPGQKGHAGNPISDDDVPTHYLFDEVLTRENLSRIITDFMVFVDDDRPKVIFPRYHQFHCVNYFLDVARIEGPGHSYLIQHSAGSGKSNTIAWLAYRLLYLQDHGDSIFDSVIICVHRTVLNEQLNNTVSMFEYTPGVVALVDSSAELREALVNGNKVIVSTIQKFGMIHESLRPYKRNFAIIFDEAHTSTTGKLNKRTKMALGERTMSEEEHEILLGEYETEDELLKAYAKIRHEGPQDNMSFYAFTATPTEKTLHAFGKDIGNGSYDAHHHYCMQQAIEEGFICDVLEDYHTCSEYFDILDELSKSSKIVLDPKKAVKVLKDLVKKNDTVIKKKARIMVDFFKNYVEKDLDGDAKAMLVVEGREEVLLYREAILEVCLEDGYDKIKIMTAFSGSLTWENESVTEQHFNVVDNRHVRSDHMAREFDTPNFNFMIAADKFQVGFDQPKLTTMFVLKKLNGVEAVQTLSRLNRVIPGKRKHTHVLDFVNTRDDVCKAFSTYYLDTKTEEGYDPTTIYERRLDVEKYGVILRSDVENFSSHFSATDPGALKRICGLLEPARTRFFMLTEEEQEKFRRSAKSLKNQYGTVTVANNFMDPYFHDLCCFIHYLLLSLPIGKSDPLPDIMNIVSLDHYRLVSTGSASIILSQGDELNNPSNKLSVDKSKLDYLSEIVKEINACCGLPDFNDEDKIMMFESITDKIASNISKTGNLEEYSDWSREAYNNQFHNLAKGCLLEYFCKADKFNNYLLNSEEGMDSLTDKLLDFIHYIRNESSTTQK